jgi:hypothetical protein
MPRSKKSPEVLVGMPVAGLPPRVRAELKRRFKNDIIEVLGGKENLAGRDIVVTVMEFTPVPWSVLKSKK